MSPTDPFSADEVSGAIVESVLGRLPESLCTTLLARAVRTELPKGHMLNGPPLSLVVSGLVRVTLASPDARQFAVCYLRRGDIAGLAFLTGRRYPLTFETVTDCRVLRLDATTFDDQRRRRPELGVAVAEQLNRHLDDVLHETALAAFGHVRQRALRHLLALAVIDPDGPATCRITHQELADAVGSARETASRTISELKSEGLVQGNHRLLVIPDPERLRRALAR